MLNVIIVEDEKHSRETLKNLLTEFCTDIHILGMAGNVNDAVALIRKSNPDLIFLDIELQTGTGFDILSQLQNLNFEVIFTTAYEQYAIKAIKFSSIDYLLKPIDLEELQKAVEKAKQKHAEQQKKAQFDVLLSHLNTSNNTNQKICLSTSEGLEFLSSKEIFFCEASGSYTTFHLKDNRQLVVSKNLKEYENLLGDLHFMRVHNKFLINLQEVKRYVKTEGGYILMNNGEQVSISVRKREEFILRMKEV